MARGVLLAGAIAWLLGGIAGLAIAAVGTERLEGVLPPLSIDTDALRGAVTAVGAGLMVVGAAHMVVLIGLGSRKRWGSAAAILLSAALAATFVALGASAATSAVATPEMAPMLLVAAVVAGVAALGYAVVALRLVSERRAGSAV